MGSTKAAPVNAQRIMTMAQQMGATANSAISLGVAQRVVLQNPGGSSTQNLGRRQDTSPLSSGSSGTPSALAAADAATDSIAIIAATSTTAPDAAASTSSSAQTSQTTVQNAATQQQPATPPTPAQATPPAAPQLLLSPTFTPVSAQALLDSANSRIAVPVSQIDGEFILTMGMAGAGTIQVAPAAPATPGQAQGQPPAAAAATTPNPPGQGQEGVPTPAGGILARQTAPATQGTITMTMTQLQEMVQRQATHDVIPVWSMMTDYVSQSTTQAVSSQAKRRALVKGYRAVPFKV